MTSRYAYPDSRGYHFCDGIRSVTKTGEYSCNTLRYVRLVLSTKG